MLTLEDTMQKLSEVMRDYFRDERLLLEARDVPVRVEKSDWQIKEACLEVSNLTLKIS